MPAGNRARPTHADIVGKLLKVRGTGPAASMWLVGDLLGATKGSQGTYNRDGQVVLTTYHNGIMHLEFMSRIADWLIKDQLEIVEIEVSHANHC